MPRPAVGRVTRAGYRCEVAAEGFQVELAREGHEGLFKATTGSYDVVVLDIMLPGQRLSRLSGDAAGEGVVTRADAHGQ